MKTSIVMATYNGEKYINKQLESIQNQSIKPTELVIVDDASSDNTCNLIRAFLEKSELPGKLVVHEKNKGYKETFLEAISYAQGDIIFLSDQDDVWRKDKIEKIISCFKNNKNIKVVNTNYNLIDSEGNTLNSDIKNSKRNKKNKNNEQINLESVLKYNVAMGCTIALKKEIKDIINENIDDIKTYNIPHDWMVNIIAAMKNGLYYLDDKLISYRIHSGNTIGLDRASNIEQRKKDYINVLKQKKEMIKLMKKIDSNIFNKEYDFMKIMINSYYIRCKMLDNKNIFGYITNYCKYKMYKVIDKKTMLYDLFLIVKRK